MFFAISGDLKVIKKALEVIPGLYFGFNSSRE